MPAYRWPIPPADRWAIIAHIRELERDRLARAAAAPAAAAPAAAQAPAPAQPPASAEAAAGKPADKPAVAK
jgi:hypothetical protein